MKTIGTIDSKRRDGKGVKVGEDWYTVMFSSVLAGVEKGDTVEIEYVTKPSPSGPDYRNIKSINKVSAPASRPVTAAAAAPASTYAARTFPVAAFSPDRSIIRQNALAHATKMAELCYCDLMDSLNMEEQVNKVIEMARMFEAYSAGDLDRVLVDAEVKKMLAMEKSE